MKFFKNIALSLFLYSGMTNALQEAKSLPMPRTMAPGFTGVNAVINNEFKQVSLSDYKGKYVVLLFYPFDYTYVCPTELIAFSENLAKFKAIGAEVLGISVDSHFTHLAWLKQDRKDGGLGKIDYPLLADISKDISADYGVLVTEEGDPMRGAALRGLFILDGDHKVRSVQVNDDAVGRSVDDALRLIQGFQYSDKHGEVCPAGWKPGDKTIKPDQDAKKEFFSQAYSDASSPPKPAFPEEVSKDTSKFSIARLTEGTPGGATPQKGQAVKAHYTGTLLDGTKFDSSRDRGDPFRFTIGVGQVISCWEKGMAMMTKGQKAILTCPPDMAYGERGFPPVIPAKATLRFDVEMIDF